jgi:membrane peptidoglycan carboxypeptidase
VVLRILKVLFALIFAGLLAGTAVAATVLLRWGRELPDVRVLDQYRLEGTSKVYARDGTIIGVLAPTIGKERRDQRPVKLSEINPTVVAAVIASEDQDFFQHYGFDPSRFAVSIFRTIFQNDQQGGSTITQQMIRTTLLSNEQSVERKIKEIMLSVQAERFFTKEEILTLYLNTAFWGGNLYGIRAAAQAYFGKDPMDLTTAEGLYLASLLPSPNTRFKQLNATRKFMKIRLERMVEGKWISRREANAVWAEPIRPRGWTNITYDSSGLAVFKKDPVTKKILAPILENPRVSVVEELTTSLAPYFMFEVRKILNARYPDQVFSGGGLRVYTTLDPKAQRAAERAVQRARRPQNTEQVAAAAVDPFTGEIRAMVGGRDQSGRDEYNRAASTQFKRSPGSSIKPLLYTLGIEKGLEQWSPMSNSFLRIPVLGTPARPGCPRNFYCPRNFPGSITTSPLPVREALNHSLNLPTVRILEDVVTRPVFRDRLRLLGFDVPDALPPSAAIGGIDATPLKMASAYASLINGGFWIEPSYIRRIETADGRVLFPVEGDEPKRRRVWSPQVAFIGLDLMRGVVMDPRSISGQFALDAKIPGRDVVGKTGTSNNVVDMWFVGSTPTLTAAVWMGNDNNDPMGERFYSGAFMPPIWADMVGNGLVGTPRGVFREPKYIAYRDTYGVKMAYSWQREDVQASNQPAAAAPVAPEDNAPPRRPEVTALPSDGEARVVIAVNTCTRNAASVNPRADEFTEPRCIENQSVRASDLEFYDPNWQPPQPPPAPPAPPPVVAPPPVSPEPQPLEPPPSNP